jgi:cell division protease FtsH
VQKIINTQYRLAETIIKENRDAMVRLAEALLVHETLDSVQIRRVVAGLPLDDDTKAVTTPDQGGTPEKEESASPFNKPILPPTPAAA